MDAEAHRQFALPEALRRFGRDRPHIYRIAVGGRLGEVWVSRLGGLSVTSFPAGEGDTPVTLLEGRIVDQSHLSGVLNTLFDLRLSLLGVEVLEAIQDDSGRDPR